MRQLGVKLLDFQQLGGSRVGVTLAQECQPVVQFVARRARRERERLLQLPDGLGVGRRILVERLAQITVLPQARVGRALAEDQPACAAHSG